jgi:hypothetical protein
MKKSEQITKGRPFKFRRTRESKKCKKPINLERKADKREREREKTHLCGLIVHVSVVLQWRERDGE